MVPIVIPIGISSSSATSYVPMGRTPPDEHSEAVWQAVSLSNNTLPLIPILLATMWYSNINIGGLSN